MVYISAKFAYILPWNLTQFTMKVRVAELGTAGRRVRGGELFHTRYLSSIQHENFDPIGL